VRDKISAAALVFSGVAFLVVFISPAPEVPAESAGTRSEGVVNRVQAEWNTLQEDDREVRRLEARGAALVSTKDASHPDNDKTGKLIAQKIEREIRRQMPAFQSRLRTIRLYEKKAEEKKAPEAKPPEAKPPQAGPPKKGADGNPAVAKKAPEQDAAAKKKAREKRKAAILKAREAARKRAAAQKAAAQKAAAEKAEQNKVEAAPE